MKMDPSDPTSTKTGSIVDEITRLCHKDAQREEDETFLSRYSLPLAGLVVAGAALATYYTYRRSTLTDSTA